LTNLAGLDSFVGLATGRWVLVLSNMRAEWTAMLADAHTCCTPVPGWDEVWTDQHIRARGLLNSPTEGLQTVRHRIL